MNADIEALHQAQRDLYYQRQRLAKLAVKAMEAKHSGRRNLPSSYAAGNFSAEQLVALHNRDVAGMLKAKLRCEREAMARQGEILTDEEFGRRVELAVAKLTEGSRDF